MRQVLISVLLTGLMGCAASAGSSDEGVAAENESAASANACHWKCGHCPPNRLCALACVPSGNCGTTCTEIMLCIQGYSWDDKSCQCVPTPGGGEPCGVSTCPASKVCCNSSCGICTEPGGMCTMQACSPTL